MRNVIVLCVILFSVLFEGCVSTNVASFIDPAYRNARFKKMLVIADYSHIEAVKIFESAVVEYLKDNGCDAIENHILLPPLRNYSDDEKIKIFNREGIDCYLILMSAGVSKSTIIVPAISKTKTNINVYRNNADITSTNISRQEETRSITTGADSKGELYDIQNGSRVWMGEANSTIGYYAGNPMADHIDVLKSMAKGLVKKMVEDGLISQ